MTLKFEDLKVGDVVLGIGNNVEYEITAKGKKHVLYTRANDSSNEWWSTIKGTEGLFKTKPKKLEAWFPVVKNCHSSSFEIHSVKYGSKDVALGYVPPILSQSTVDAVKAEWTEPEKSEVQHHRV